jgi:hypothetical protein
MGVSNLAGPGPGPPGCPDATPGDGSSPDAGCRAHAPPRVAVAGLDARNLAPQPRSRRPMPPGVAFGRDAPHLGVEGVHVAQYFWTDCSGRLGGRFAAGTRCNSWRHARRTRCLLADRPRSARRPAVVVQRWLFRRRGGPRGAPGDRPYTPWGYRRIALRRTAGRCYPLRALDAGDVRGSPRKPPNRDPRERVHRCQTRHVRCARFRLPAPASVV